MISFFYLQKGVQRQLNTFSKSSNRSYDGGDTVQVEETVTKRQLGESSSRAFRERLARLLLTVSDVRLIDDPSLAL